MAKILAISGSPVPNSNVDRAMKTILEAAGQPYDFIKLSTKNIRPCKACLGCVKDNHCKQLDDYTLELETLARDADVWIIGGWPAFGVIDGFTKAFCERTFSLRHMRFQTKGKKGIIVAGGFHHSASVRQFLEGFFMGQGFDLLGALELKGNVSCLSCGQGEICPISGVKYIWGPEATITPDMFWQFEKQANLVNAAKELGHKISLLLSQQ